MDFTAPICSMALRGDDTDLHATKYGASEPICTKLMLARRFVMNDYAEFHDNPTKDLVVDTRSQKDRQTESPQMTFSLRKEPMKLLLRQERVPQREQTTQ